MSEIRVFKNADFGMVRTVVIDGEPWFVAKDISDRLGYAKPSNMTKMIDDEDKKIVNSKELTSGSNSEHQVYKQSYQLSIINESGLYAAIFGSKQGNAKAFKKWVTSEVLPAIRRTGSYSTNQIATTDDKIALLAQGHQELRRDIEDVRQEAAKAKTEMEIMKKDIDDFKKGLPLFPSEHEEITKVINERVMTVMGGKKSPAYNNRIVRSSVFGDIYSELHRNFEIRSCKNIPRRYFEIAKVIINSYIPSYSLRNDIERFNNK